MVEGGRPAAPEHTVSLRRQQLIAQLELARAELAAGGFAQAQARAETVLRSNLTPDIRSTALVLAGDAAYGTGAYRKAADRYGEVLLSDEVTADAPHATLALGWAELRLGRKADAGRTWIRLARQFPADPRAPIALILAAELSAQTGETVVARKLFDRTLESHPASPDAELARLGRSVLAMREGRTVDGVRDLRVLVGTGRPSVPVARKRVIEGLKANGAPAGAEHRLFLTNRFDGGLTLPTDDRRAAENGAATTSAAPQTAGPFQRFAAPFLDGAGDAETTPYVLHGLVLLATEDKAWPEAQTLASSLVGYAPGYAATPALLKSLADRAAAEGQWAIVRTSYGQALARNGGTQLAPKARVDFAEALYRTGDAAQARVELTRFMAVAPTAGEAPRALYLLADVNEALEQPAEALAAYEWLRRSYPRAAWTGERRLRHARLIQQVPGRQREARTLLEEIVQFTEGDAHAEASFRLARALAADGEHGQAVDWYMATAYGTAQRSPWYRPALLGAGHSLVALKRTQAAIVVYRNLLPSARVGPLPSNGQPSPDAGSVEDQKLAAEAAYSIAEIARESGRHEQAVEMYLTAAYLAPESSWARRSLLGAVRSQVALGDRAAAESNYRRLVESGADEPEIVDQAKRALRSRGGEASRRGR